MFDKFKNNITATFENYLKAIWIISKEKGFVRVKDLADALGLKGGTVVAGLKMLAQKGLVVHHHYGHIELTQAGKLAALEVLQKHNVIYDFLKNWLMLNEETSEKDACALEHHISKETLHRLIHFLEYIKEKVNLEDLHKFLEEKVNPKVKSLNLIEEENVVIIKEIEAPKNIKQKLMDLGVLPGKEIFVEKKAPFGDPIELIIDNFHISLGIKEAEMIKVLKKDTIKLSNAKPGNYYISFLKVTPNQLKQLNEIGLQPGKEIEIIENHNGNLTLKVDENKIILQEPLTHSIYLEEYHDKE